MTAQAADARPAADAGAPRHGWPGVLYYAMLYTAAVGGLVYAAVEPWTADSTRDALTGAAGGVLFAAMSAGAGWSVHRFKPWGWYIAMLLLTGWLLEDARTRLADVLSAAPGEVGWSVVPFAGKLLLHLLWIVYFWRRRGDFDI